MGYLQTKYNWTDSTIQSIAWKSLSLAINRIDRNVLLTKVCNNILPTFHQLHKFGMQPSTKCPLCDEDETTQHMIQCEHPSRTSWRCGLIKALRTKMSSTNTTFSLLETFVSAISDWMENGFVNIRKYPYRYHEAIHQQDQIGWYHLFSGKISQKWLHLYEDTYIKPRIRKPTNQQQRIDSYVWGAHIVEIILRQMISLWEQRNKDVHGDNNEDKDRILKEKLSAEFTRLNSLQHECRPRDQFLFRDDPNEFLKRSTTKQIATYITTSRRAIINSYNQWKKHTDAGVSSVIGWLTNDNPGNESVFTRLRQSFRKRMLDGRQKERRRRRRLDDHPANQQSLHGYFTLTQPL